MRPTLAHSAPTACRTCNGRGWSLATYSLCGGTYLLFCAECEVGPALKEAVEVRERRRGEGRES